MARNQNVTQFRVNSQAEFRDTQNIEEVALFGADGSAIDLDSVGAQGAHVALVTAPNGSDAGTTQTLANANKVAINALITSLQNAGLLSAT